MPVTTSPSRRSSIMVCNSRKEVEGGCGQRLVLNRQQSCQCRSCCRSKLAPCAALPTTASSRGVANGGHHLGPRRPTRPYFSASMCCGWGNAMGASSAALSFRGFVVQPPAWAVVPLSRCSQHECVEALKGMALFLVGAPAGGAGGCLRGTSAVLPAPAVQLSQLRLCSQQRSACAMAQPHPADVKALAAAGRGFAPGGVWNQYAVSSRSTPESFSSSSR